MQTYGKPFFVGFNNLKPETPIFHTAPTTEIEHPWRVCPKSLVVKLPNNRGMVLGRWRKNVKPWEDALLEILKGREIFFADEKEAITGTRSAESLEHAGVSVS